MLKQTDGIQFDTETKEGMVLVDFFAKWCAPCSKLMPQLESLSEQITDVKFVKVDADASPELSGKYGVMGLPTVMLMKDGEVVERHTGAFPIDFYVDMIKRNR